MFNRHLITDEDTLYLFVNNDFEFSKEFSNKKEIDKKQNLLSHVKNYLKSRNIVFNGKRIFIVVSGIVIGTISLGGLKAELDINETPKTQYVVSLDKFNEIKIPEKNNIETGIPKENINTNNIPSINQDTTKNINSKVVQNATTQVVTPTQSLSAEISNPVEATTPIVQTPTLENPVNVHMLDGTIQTVSFEDFIFGVVAAEMPAAFNVEALKAQSVATRTYYLKAISQGKMITQINSGQVTYKTINDLKGLWGSSFNTYYTKIKNAVDSTKGEYITYNGSYIEAVYYSTNNGRTESSIDVWGNYYPYLISVDSSWDINTPSYYKEIDKDLSVINNILGLDINEATPVEVISRTDGDRIKEIKIGDTVYTGKYIREALGLRSTDFDLSISGNKMHIATRGYGHGVGMSQYGANEMGKIGYSYKQIINHYYPGTSIQK